MSQIFETTSCKFCNGVYINAGSCPKYGLKFRNSPCPIGEITIKYKKVKVRNDIPIWKFWKSHYSVEKIKQ